MSLEVEEIRLMVNSTHQLLDQCTASSDFNSQFHSLIGASISSRALFTCFTTKLTLDPRIPRKVKDEVAHAMTRTADVLSEYSIPPTAELTVMRQLEGHKENAQWRAKLASDLTRGDWPEFIKALSD
jgi:hypothetical protein